VQRPKRRYIITGGAGFIGSNLAAELILREPDCDVTILDDFSSGSYANILEACERRGVTFTGEVLPISTRDWVLLRGLDDYVDKTKPFALFHLGATTDTTKTDEAAMIENNAGSGWGTMLGACAEANIRLVYASSAATYGTPPQTARREPFPLDAAGKPNNVYGFSKWLMENTHRVFVAEGVLRQGRGGAERGTGVKGRGKPPPWIVGLRYFNVFGPGETRKGKMASIAHQLASQCLAGQRPRLFKHGEQARDQISVDDVVDCTLAAAGLGPSGDRVTPGIYNLGSGKATTFNDIVEAVRKGLGLRPGELEVEYFDMPESVRTFYQDFTLADMTQTQRGLGWKPGSGRALGGQDPIKATVQYAAWMRSNNRNRN